MQKDVVFSKVYLKSSYFWNFMKYYFITWWITFQVLWMLVQWTAKMCPFHISNNIFGCRYTLSLLCANFKLASLSYKRCILFAEICDMLSGMRMQPQEVTLKSTGRDRSRTGDYAACGTPPSCARPVIRARSLLASRVMTGGALRHE